MIPYPHGGYRHPDDPGEPTTGQPRVSVSDLEASILEALARGRHVVEIGTGLGVSTRALAAHARTVHTIDVDPWVHATIWPDLPSNTTGVPDRRLVAGRFDLAFVDGDHSRQAALDDLTWCAARARIVIAHDTNYESVRRACDQLGGFSYLPTEHGLGIRWSD